MPKPRPPHLNRQVTRHGKVVWYVRIGKGPYIRLRSAYGTDGFWDEYRAALSGKPQTKRGPASGSLSWLIGQYRDSQAWAKLSRATQRQRENIFRGVVATSGNVPARDIGPKSIAKGIDDRRQSQARHFLDAMRGLYKWAVKAGHVASDPTETHHVEKKSGEGFAPWTDDEIAAFEQRWPLGTRERVAFDTFRYTGLRRGDVAMLGKQHVRDGVIAINTEKTGTRVTIPVLPELQATWDAGPTGELFFVATEDGQKMQKESLGNMFREACKAAGVNKSAHGIRKYAATTAANNGATVAQMEAMFGWEGGRMASHYTRSADRSKLAKEAIKFLAKAKA